MKSALPIFLNSLMVFSYCATINDQDDTTNGLLSSVDHALVSSITSINDLSGDILFHISSFFKNHNPYESISGINHHCFSTVHAEFPMKQLVMKRFNIPEFENVGVNEPELNSILNLSWCGHDTFAIFGCLMEDLVSEKRQYNVLFRPLILHLSQMSMNLTNEQRLNYSAYFLDNYSLFFSNHLASICANHGHYDLVFEFVQDYSKSLVKMLSSIADREAVMEFFKSNPQHAIQFGKACLIRDSNLEYNEVYQLRFAYKWVAECLIYESPEAFYTEMLALKPFILKFLEKDLFLSYDIPEYEYARIHAHMQKLLNFYLLPSIDWNNEPTRDFGYYILINDLRFGCLQELNVPKYYDKDVLFNLACAALLGNKPGIFLAICDSPDGLRHKIMDEFGKINDLNCNCLQASCFKVIFELIVSGAKIFSNESYSLNFLLNFYALKSVKTTKGLRFNLEFVALEKLLILGFPSRILFEASLADQLMSMTINSILKYVKVVDENTFNSLLTDIERESFFKTSTLTISFEVFELISHSPSLIERFMTNGRKFLLSPTADNFIKYLEQPNLEMTSKIFQLNRHSLKDLAKLKTRKQLKAFEEIIGMKIGQYFPTDQIRNEYDYFRLRNLFSYWIKGEQRDKIKEIRSDVILRLLRLELPEEMTELLGN